MAGAESFLSRSCARQRPRRDETFGAPRSTLPHLSVQPVQVSLLDLSSPAWLERSRPATARPRRPGSSRRVVGGVDRLRPFAPTSRCADRVHRIARALRRRPIHVVSRTVTPRRKPISAAGACRPALPGVEASGEQLAGAGRVPAPSLILAPQHLRAREFDHLPRVRQPGRRACGRGPRHPPDGRGWRRLR